MLTFLLCGAVLLLAACTFNMEEPNQGPTDGLGSSELQELLEGKDEGQNIPEAKQPDPPKEPIRSTVTLHAVGDILVSNSMIKDARVTDESYDFTKMFEYVKPYLQNADLAIANQETVVGGVELGLSGYPRFNSPVEIADAVVDTGFHVVTLANNHTLDRDEKGVLMSREYWDTLDILTTGAYVSEEDRNEVRLIEINGIQFAVLNYTYGTNGIPIPENKEYLVNLIDEQLIEQDVQKAQLLADVIIVALHWGNEYEVMPNEEQKRLAQFISDLGVDIILGTHPHVLQPPAWITREDGKRTFVAYSLGNFLSSQDQLPRLIGGVIGLDITKVEKGDQVDIELSNPTFYATYNYYSNWRNFKLYPMDRLNEKLLPNFEQHYENIQQHMRTYIEDLTIVKTPE